LEAILNKSNIIKGLFVTFEGIDGAGKSSQIAKLKKNFKKHKINKVLFTREPGGTLFGNKIRKLLVNNNNKNEKLSNQAELLLLLAARNEHIIKVIKPYMIRNYIVICDRFIDSTYAYQCRGDNKLKALYSKLNKLIINDFCPNLTFLLDISPDLALKRIKKRKVNNELDKLNKSHFTKIRESYLRLAQNNKRICVVDATKDINALQEEIIDKILIEFNHKNAF